MVCLSQCFIFQHTTAYKASCQPSVIRMQLLELSQRFVTFLHRTRGAINNFSWHLTFSGWWLTVTRLVALKNSFRLNDSDARTHQKVGPPTAHLYASQRVTHQKRTRRPTLATVAANALIKQRYDDNNMTNCHITSVHQATRDKWIACRISTGTSNHVGVN